MKKIIFITNIPTYHKLPMLNHLSVQLKKHNIHLKVYFLQASELRRDWHIQMTSVSFNYEILHSAHIQMAYEWTIIIPFSLLLQLFKEHPDYIICGGFSFAILFVRLFSFFTGVQFSVWSGEVTSAASSKSLIRKMLRKFILDRVSSVIAYGTKAAEYIHTLKPDAKIFIAYNTSDITFFARNTNKIRNNRQNLIKKHGLRRADVHIIFLSGLVKRKGCVQLLMALSKLNYKTKNFMLHIVGDGIEKRSLVRLTKKLQLEKNVIFWGYKSKHELPTFFALGDIFVFPTLHDIWGLVLNEAMAAGLPVIASKYAGATHDLINDGTNGYVVDPYNIDELASKIYFLVKNPKIREIIGKNAQSTMLEKYTIQKSTSGFLNAILFSFDT